MLIAAVSAFLFGAVVYDSVSHRLPNRYLLLGLLIALLLQLLLGGWRGGLLFGAGLLTGFVLFIPFYVLGGMAAGDVKLMAVTGSYLGAAGALWAVLYSLLAGAVLGILYLLYKGQLSTFLARCLAMASLRTFVSAEEGDAARHRFPYAIAVFTGTLISLLWRPFAV